MRQLRMVRLMSWASDVYAYDHRNAEICRQMQIDGFAFDREQAAKLSIALAERQQEASDTACRAVGSPVNIFSAKEIQEVITGHFGAPIYFRSTLTGRPSFGKDAMRGYAAARNENLRAFALSVLQARNARVLRRTCIDKIKVSDAGRVHPSWLNYGTVTGRWSCHDPNLMNLPRHGTDPTHKLGGIRSLYYAPEGYRLVCFDAKQIEMRVAAYVSGDLAMIKACEESDLHTANARVIFGAAFDNADPAMRDTLRTMAKTSGFAVCYMAEAGTVFNRLIADGQRVTLQQVEALLAKLKRGFSTYYEYQAAKLLDAIRLGYVESPILGRRRWVGHEPGAPEVANFPIQAGASEIVNLGAQTIAKRLQRLPACRIVAQVHDSLAIETSASLVPEVEAMILDVYARPVKVGNYEVAFPVDLKTSQRWK